MLAKILAFITAIATSIGGLFGFQHAADSGDALSQLSSGSSSIFTQKYDFNQMADDTLADINALRTSRGLAPLVVDEAMTAQAKAHVAGMATTGLTNSPEYTHLNESTYAFAFPKLDNTYPYDQFYDDPQDRQKMLDPKYTKVGMAFDYMASDDRVIIGVVKFA